LGGDRLEVRKTYELYVGGTFARSGSGRSYPVTTPAGAFLANAARASRTDVRDAVRAARSAFAAWAGATAYHRGQVLYRVAELAEGRRAQLVAEVAAAEGLPAGRAGAVVDAAVDRWVWYAGWTDKIAAVFGASNPVAGPYLSFSVPEPSGVVGVLASQTSSLLGLVSAVAPVVAAGNACVVLAAQDRPLPAVTLAEVLASAELPGGVVNVLTGHTAELAPWLASHREVDGLDLTGAPAGLRRELETAAADSVKRLLRVPAGEPDWTAEPGTGRLTAFLEIKTVWHPIGV
jgi:acyl-CoA reductase-like NAD-dependent aldehyde dehydrogenase